MAKKTATLKKQTFRITEPGDFLLMLILYFGVILREESYLEAKFGQQYLALKREVRCWI